MLGNDSTNSVIWIINSTSIGSGNWNKFSTITFMSITLLAQSSNVISINLNIKETSSYSYKFTVASLNATDAQISWQLASLISWYSMTSITTITSKTLKIDNSNNEICALYILDQTSIALLFISQSTGVTTRSAYSLDSFSSTDSIMK